jgi:predicted acyltransferase
MQQLPTKETSHSTSERILSVDVLRGFDMFWIVGGMGFAGAILQCCPEPVRRTLLPQLSHVAWDGFAFCDLIFPLFVFIVGITTVLSLSRILAERGRRAAYGRLVRRALLLFLLGIIYSGGVARKWPDVRLLGVLQRIALCYFFTGLAVIHLRVRGTIVMIVVLLAGYWALMSFVPAPGREIVSFAPGENLANYIDSKYLGGRKYDGSWDPEGLLSTFPAVATCLLGLLAGEFLRNQDISQRAKIGGLIVAGVLSLLLGYAWGLQFPIIKKIWTSSYVLVAGGYSLILLGVFYAVVDVWRLRWWTAPLIWIGSNAITIYMVQNFVSFDELARRLVGGDISAAMGEAGGRILVTGVSLALTLALVWFLYRRKIFLRV